MSKNLGSRIGAIAVTVHAMPRARKHLVCVADTPYYHVTSRCVRRAFLCGFDHLSGKSYEHRRGWIETRVRVLSSLFSIRLCAYAIMSNHYHLVVKLNPEEADDWSDDDVLRRWTALFKGPLLIQRQLAGKSLRAIEQAAVASMVTIYRQRLTSLSWFMKCLNEPIARQANAEDECTGHFWEARFHSQALLSEKALFTAMAYVDLNPVRANIAKTPEASDYTSIKIRLDKDPHRNALAKAISAMLENDELYHFETPIRPLMPFSDAHLDSDAIGDKERSVEVLPMKEAEYLGLVDDTGRIINGDKRGSIDPKLEPILLRLGLTPEQWTEVSSDFREHYRNGDLRLKHSA